jgi:hypothetical protein
MYAALLLLKNHLHPIRFLPSGTSWDSMIYLNEPDADLSKSSQSFGIFRFFITKLLEWGLYFSWFDNYVV